MFATPALGLALSYLVAGIRAQKKRQSEDCREECSDATWRGLSGSQGQAPVSPWAIRDDHATYSMSGLRSFSPHRHTPSGLTRVPQLAGQTDEINSFTACPVRQPSSLMARRRLVPVCLYAPLRENRLTTCPGWWPSFQRATHQPEPARYALFVAAAWPDGIGRCRRRWSAASVRPADPDASHTAGDPRRR